MLSGCDWHTGHIYICMRSSEATGQPQFDVDISAGPHTHADTNTLTHIHTHTECGREQGGLILQMHCAKTVRQGSVRFFAVSERAKWKEGVGEKQESKK